MIRSNRLPVMFLLAIIAPAKSGAQAPQPQVTEIASLPGVDYIDQAVLLPNGRIIVYATNDSIFAFDRTAKRTAFLATHDGGGWRFGAVSPRGDRIVFRRHGEDGKGHYLWTLPIDPASGAATGPAQRLTTTESQYPGISPDGKLVSYAEGPEGTTLAVVPATGGVERTLMKYQRRLSPATWSADGRWLFVAVGQSPDTLVTVERVPLAGGKSEPRNAFPRSVRTWDGGSWGFIDDRLVLFRPDLRSQMEGRLAYLTPSGAHGELTLPRAASVSDGGAELRTLMTVTTHPAAGHLVNLTDGRVRELETPDGALTSFSATSYSPDGRRLVVQFASGDRLTLGTVDANGSNPQRYPVRIYPERRRVDWSPDGKQLAYFADGGGAQLAVLDVSSGATKVVASAPVNVAITNFVWRPDSKSLVLLKRTMDGKNRLFEARVDGGERLLRDLAAEFPEYNPGGGFASDQLLIMGSQSWKLLAVPTGGGAARAIPGTDHRLGAPGVSPDGTSLLYLIRSAEGSITSAQLMVTAGDSLRTLNLPFTVDRRFPFSTISPDGRQAAMVGMTSGDTTAKLFLVPLDGGSPRMLARVANRVAGKLVFSPDGRTLLYNTLGLPTATLYQLDLSPVLHALENH